MTSSRNPRFQLKIRLSPYNAKGLLRSKIQRLMVRRSFLGQSTATPVLLPAYRRSHKNLYPVIIACSSARTEFPTSNALWELANRQAGTSGREIGGMIHPDLDGHPRGDKMCIDHFPGLADMLLTQIWQAMRRPASDSRSGIYLPSPRQKHGTRGGNKFILSLLPQLSVS
jgi:hypothetical protein